MKRTRLLAASAAALCLAGTTIGTVATGASAAARPDNASNCAYGDGVRTCLSISGRGLVLGDMVGSITNVSDGPFEAAVLVFGPDGFVINSSGPTLGEGDGVQVGWLQSTASAPGNYYAEGVLERDGKPIRVIGPVVHINVFA